MSDPATSSSAGSAASTSPYNYRIVGVLLAVGSGILIGSSFVFKKKGLIASQKGGPAGVGVAYLKNPLWWTGMIMMIFGELCNFGAYAFVEAIIVTPLGALSVVISAILSSLFLNERLSFFGWVGCFQCIVGSVIIAINGPEEQSASTIKEFKHLFLAPGFLSFGSVVIATSLIIIFFVAPRYGDKSMLWYILVCSLIGGLSVSCTQGLGASIVTSIRGYNQFKNWFIYFLLAFVAVTLVTEIYFLNRALALFNTAMVTPTYYVIFTFFTLVTSVILYQGVKASATQLITIVLGFLIICSGITILQLSKVDPKKLEDAHKLDRKSALLIKVAQQEVEKPAIHLEEGTEVPDGEAVAATEEPGVDALRGFNGLAGTIARARRRTTVITDGGSDADLQRTGSIFVPNFGLGRHSSLASPQHQNRTLSSTGTGPHVNWSAGSRGSRNADRTPSTAENGLLAPPTGHGLEKATTAPSALDSPSRGRGNGHIWSSRVPRTGPSPHRTGPALFWQRRTGSGSRKVSVDLKPEEGEGESVGKSPGSVGQHSVLEDTVLEDLEEDRRDERSSSATYHTTQQNAHEPDLRTLLAKQLIEERLHPESTARDRSSQTKILVEPPSSAVLKTSLSADDADGMTVRAIGRGVGANQQRLQLPSFSGQAEPQPGHQTPTTIFATPDQGASTVSGHERMSGYGFPLAQDASLYHPDEAAQLRLTSSPEEEHLDSRLHRAPSPIPSEIPSDVAMIPDEEHHDHT